MHRWTLHVLLVAIGVLSGCPESTFSSEEEQWEFSDTGLVVGSSTGLCDDVPLLVGSDICPTPYFLGQGVGDDDSAADDWVMLLDCFEHSTEGPGAITQTDASLCVHCEGPGELTWHMEPVPCEADELGYQTIQDRVVFDVIAGNDAHAVLYPWADIAIRDMTSPAGDDPFPPDLVPAEGEPYQVLAGAEVIVYVRLKEADSDQSVAWNLSSGGPSARATQGSFEITEPADVGSLGLKLEEGAKVVVELTVGEHTWDAVTLTAVGEDALASVELVVGAACLSTGEGASNCPVAARALFRDTDGRAVYGVPAEWKVRKGMLAVEPGPSDEPILWSYKLPSADYALLVDDCRPPSESWGEQSAKLEVSYGGLSDSMQLTWTVPADDQSWGDPDEGWEKHEACLGRDCSCDATGRKSNSNALVSLLLLRWAVRRRAGRRGGVCP